MTTVTDLHLLFFSLSFSSHPSLFSSLSVVPSFFWTRNEGPRTGSRQKQHNTAVRIAVTAYATRTTEQNHRLTQKRLVIRMKSPPVATSPASTSSFPWKLGRLCSLRATCARIPDACGTFSDVAVLATFIACVVLGARGEAAAFWACHQRLHNSANELRRRAFHGHQHRLNPRDLSLHHHRHIDNLVDV